MRTLISFILVSLWIVSAKAQPYGNEWINYSQKYWRFPITEDGIYRINYASLVQAGYPVNSISAKNIQLFARGQEIPHSLKVKVMVFLIQTILLNFMVNEMMDILIAYFIKIHPNRLIHISVCLAIPPIITLPTIINSREI